AYGQPGLRLRISRQVPNRLVDERKEHGFGRQLTLGDIERRSQQQHAATSHVAFEHGWRPGVEAREHLRAHRRRQVAIAVDRNGGKVSTAWGAERLAQRGAVTDAPD